MLICSLMLYLAVMISGFDTTFQAGSVNEVRRLEQSWVDGLLERSAEVFERILDADLTQIGPAGETGGKRSFLEFFRTGDWQYVEARLEQLDVRVFGDVGVATGRLKRTVRLGGKADTAILAFTHVWKLTGNEWRVVHTQSAVVP